MPTWQGVRFPNSDAILAHLLASTSSTGYFINSSSSFCCSSVVHSLLNVSDFPSSLTLPRTTLKGPFGSESALAVAVIVVVWSADAALLEAVNDATSVFTYFKIFCDLPDRSKVAC